MSCGLTIHATRCRFAARVNSGVKAHDRLQLTESLRGKLAVMPEKLLAAFEGGSVHTAEQDGQFLVIINQVALLDMLDPEEQEGIEGVQVLAFPSAASRDEYLRERGWPSAL